MVAWGIPAAIGGSALLGFLGGQQQGDAMRDAANMQARASEAASRQQREMWDITNGYFSPYRDAGALGLSQLQSIATQPFQEWQGGEFTGAKLADDPGYQFRMDQANKALEARMGKSGNTGDPRSGYSGAFLQGISKLNQGLASQEYGNAYQRFNDSYQRFNNERQQRWNQMYQPATQLAQLGYGANTSMAGSAMGLGQQLGANMMGAANAQAAAMANAPNPLLSGLQGGLAGAQMYNAFNTPEPKTPPAVKTT